MLNLFIIVFGGGGRRCRTRGVYIIVPVPCGYLISAPLLRCPPCGTVTHA
jgi:hypothetical protein